MKFSLRQRVLLSVALLLAFGALGVAVAYSGDTSVAGPSFSGSPVDGGGARPEDATAPTEELDINPIQGWFPQSGAGSACSEAVGVDLIPGYSAILTINGVEIPPEETNVMVDSNGDGVADAVSAGGSQGQITWGPEPDCPFGEILRATANTVSACIYRTVDGPAGCRVIRRPDTFDF